MHAPATFEPIINLKNAKDPASMFPLHLRDIYSRISSNLKDEVRELA